MENTHYFLDYQECPNSSDTAILLDGINTNAFQAKSLSPIQTFGIFFKNVKGHVLGGCTGTILYGCLYIDMLWISENFRHQGWGRKLMQKVEKIGKKRQCTFATVNTMDWEALAFYQKLGYVIEFTREGFKHHSKMHFLRKQL